MWGLLVKLLVGLVTGVTFPVTSSLGATDREPISSDFLPAQVHISSVRWRQLEHVTRGYGVSPSAAPAAVQTYQGTKRQQRDTRSLVSYSGREITNVMGQV